MTQNNLLRSPDIAITPPSRLGDIGTPSAEASMPPLRLSDIMTPSAETSGVNGVTRGDSGHEASATTAAAGWELHVPDPHQKTHVDSETVGRLKQDVSELNDENRLLRQKLRLLQKNSNLKQVALIGTVISWFGDKGLLEEDVSSAYRLTSMMLSARETENVVPSIPESSNKVDDVPWRRQTVEGTLGSHGKAKGEYDKSSSPDCNSRCDNDDTSHQWLNQSLKGSFNPPFSSSQKETKTSVKPREEETFAAEDGPLQPAEFRDIPVFPVGSQLQTEMEANTKSFDESVKRLDTRLCRMENAVHSFGGQHAETRAYMTRLRQNAVKRFRVWKAIAASRRLAAVDSSLDYDEAENGDLREQPITPTPLTQYPLKTGSKNFVGGNSNQTILGEIAFQVERRILAFVFQRKEILYGYNLGNLDIMIRTSLDQGSRPVLQRRYDLLMGVLRGYGWLTGRHPQFVAEMIARHGTLQDVETAKAEAMKRGWHNPSELKRGLLCLCPVTEVLDMLVILDCLLHMARNDGLPVFLW